MLLKQNAKPESDISADQATAWLKKNPHRTAEHMTGKLVNESVLQRASRRACHRWYLQRPESSVLHQQKLHGKVQRNVISVRQALLSGSILKPSEVGDPRWIRLETLTKLGVEGLDIITLKRGNRYIGYCLASTVFDKEEDK